ncbi:MAG: alpha/beta hydrolase [Marmoricola sp.]|nr:alpha/beta hydrolase [Marmoricola sp.]
MSTITPREATQVRAVNESGKQPVVFVHGLWLLAGTWQPWRDEFEKRGFATVAVDWPDDPADVVSARANPEVFAGKRVGQVADHIGEVISGLSRKPVVIGHSFGGLLAQIVAGRGLAAATVAIDPAPARGVLPLPLSALKAASPVLMNPLNRGRAVTLSFEEFRYGFANAVSEAEARALYEAHHVAAPGRPLFQAAAGNFNPFSETKVDRSNPDRGPMLFISGEKDHIVPWAITNASFKAHRKNPAVTEIVEIPGRGHSLVFDAGWPEVAEAAFTFLGTQGVTA